MAAGAVQPIEAVKAAEIAKVAGGIAGVGLEAAASVGLVVARHAEMMMEEDASAGTEEHPLCNSQWMKQESQKVLFEAFLLMHVVSAMVGGFGYVPPTWAQAIYMQCPNCCWTCLVLESYLLEL